MVELIRTASPIWKLVIKAVCVLGGILIVGGILLAILGGSAEITFTLFGNEFSSTSVGVALAFIGAVVAAVTFRRVLSSMDKVATGGEPNNTAK